MIHIGDVAFSQCGMGTIIVPGSVISMDDEAFDFTTTLTNAIIENGCPRLGDYMFDEDTSLASVTIPNSVTSIGEETFEQCTSLTNVTIPNSVTTILDFAFEESGVTSVTIPASVTNLGQAVFDYCDSITNLVILAPITSIQYGLCEADPALASVTLPNTLTFIDDYSFQGCALTSITIPAGVTNVGKFSFQSNPDLPTFGPGATHRRTTAPPSRTRLQPFITTPTQPAGDRPFGSRPTVAIGAPTPAPHAGGIVCKPICSGFTGASGQLVAVDLQRISRIPTRG